MPSLVALFVAMAAPGLVVACSDDDTSSSAQTPTKPAASSPSDEHEPPAPSSSNTTTPDAASPDASTSKDAGKDAAPPPKDVAGSAACTAYCQKMKSACARDCDPAIDCAVPKGQCAASTEAYLQCQSKADWYCGGDGFSIVGNCKQDKSLCD
ncbi:hypothetical protein [Labilithrix luteola]|nr:hypothetical protein [Labilithrix luteola]